jgi:hypothetical protein
VTIVVLVILVVLWAAVLGPSLLRRTVDRRSGDSIGAFHRQLRVLERAGPTLVSPAFRLTTALPEGMRPGAAPVGPVLPARPGLVLMRPHAAPATPPGNSRQAGTTPARLDPYFLPGASKRRRDVLLCLVSAVLGTGVLGAIPALRPLLIVTAVAAGFSGLYVGLLVRMRRRADERAAKLRYLPRPQVDEPTLVVRRSAAH